MTDAQLIELLEQKPPSELTESEIAELRLRVPHSVPLQQAVAAAIELDQSLAELLGELRISMDSILNRASAARSRPRWVWLIGGGTLALIGLVLLLVWQMRRPPDEMAIDPDDPTSVARLEEKTRQEMARVAMHGRGWKPGQAAEFRVAGASGEAGEPAAGADSVAETTVPGGVAVTETRTATGAEPGANPAATVVASSGDAPTSSATSAADAAMLKALERADPAAAEAYKAKLKAIEAAEKLAAEKVAAAGKDMGHDPLGAC